MASQAGQKRVELKITYRVSVIDVWDWEITVRDWKITTWDYKITLWEIKIAIREWKNVMRDHNYQSRMKNCHVRSILTVDNENRCVRKRNHHSRLSIGFFLSWWDISSQRRVFWRDFLLYCGRYKTWTTDYGLRTMDYGLRTGYKTRTKHYGLGIKYGLRYKTRTQNYGLSIKYEERF